MPQPLEMGRPGQPPTGAQRGARGEGSERPTIADIARRAGVSPTAVSFALNDRPGISDETRTSPASRSWQKLLSFKAGNGGTGEAQVRLFGRIRASASRVTISLHSIRRYWACLVRA